MSELVVPAFEVRIDPRIERDDQLRAAVTAATDYFIEQYEPRTPTDPPTAPTIRWEFQAGSPTPLRMIVTEHNELGYREVFKTFNLSDLRGEIERNVNRLTLWRRLLDLRSAKRLAIMEQLLREAEAQEEAARGVTQSN